LVISVLMLLSGCACAQEFVKPKDDMRKSAFDKKFHWGFVYTQGWSSIKGSNLPAPYFSKQSIGLQVTATYFPISFLGFSLGAGYQQRGTGIRDNHLGPVDSTFRDRLRFNSIEFPIAVVLRTPKDVIKGLRLSASLGVVPVLNQNSREVKVSLEPNVADLDVTKDVTSKYFKNDFAIQVMAGPEIDMAASQIVKIQFYYAAGTANVYTAGQGTGHNQNIGVRIAWMF